MKIRLTIIALILPLTLLAQKQIKLNHKIAIVLPKGLNAFDDKENKELINKILNGSVLPEPYKLLVVDFAYKKDNVIVRFFAGKSEWPDDYIKEKMPKYDKLEIKHIDNKDCLILNYSIKPKAFYKIEVSNKANKKLVTIEMEYPNGVNEDKKNAENLINELIKGIKFN
ncbi:hypothetical protein H9N25_03250 [Pedobacter riviphilus]|uniref:DUF4252 domain-containing protein n=1 Tax=Pedobacter riviphilus TaxID=2766984 RepID=A0ABX6TJ10_9SPHI|nr:hypothetical protein [Pedobacter riviphilus]QNR85507.1 hypothetical protein H9N25_03250 [Pedobacter riviphilus]